MTKFYSKSTGGFYSDEVHAEIPKDAVQIDDSRWQYLLDGQSQGQEIVSDPAGNPFLKTPAPAPVMTTEQKLANLGLTVEDLRTLLSS